tara:strand:+ start:109 stop:633 length:525 start_codon:yes stop_codon:yes gene_type:complete
MDTLALQNINTLLDINEKSTFIFKDRKILINNDDSTEHINENNINTEYILYFTFNQLFNAIRHENINRNKLINDLDQALDNLYENESFQKLIDNDKQIDEIMNDILLKLDIITEKYYNHYECSKFYNKLNNFYNYLIEDFINRIPLHIYTNVEDIDEDIDEETLLEINSIDKID